MACGAQGAALGALRLFEAEAHFWRGQNADLERCAVEAMRWLPAGSELYYRGARIAATAHLRLGHFDQLVALVDGISAPATGARERATQIRAWAGVGHSLLLAGRLELAGALAEKAEALAAQIEDLDPVTWALVDLVTATRMQVAGDVGAHIRLTERAAARYAEAGDLRGSCHQRGNVAYAHQEAGNYEQAERALREVIAAADRMGLVNVVTAAKHNLGLVLARRGALDEALAVETEAREALAAQGNRRLEAGSRVYLSEIHERMGDLEGAERQVEAVMTLEGVDPATIAQASAQLALVRLKRGRTEAAFADAKRAFELLEQLGGTDEGDALIRLAWAEALRATGDAGRATAAIAAARERLLRRASDIRDGALRRSFLENVPEHARTLALAREWCGER